MKTVQAIPHHSLIAFLNMKDAAKAIEFYKNVFGAKEIGRITGTGDMIGHAELQIGDSRLMIAEEMPEWGNKSPDSLGGSPVKICLYVEDVDSVYEKAISLGAKTEGNMAVKDQFYGDRSGNLIDPFGHQWVISQHIEEVSYEELQKRYNKMMEEHNAQK